MLTAMRLLALCCPGAMPQANKTDVDILTKQYANWWSKANQMMTKIATSAATATAAHRAAASLKTTMSTATMTRPRAPTRSGVGVLDFLAARSEEAKKLSDAAKEEETTLSALLASVED